MCSSPSRAAWTVTATLRWSMCWKSIRVHHAPCPMSARPPASNWPRSPPAAWPGRLLADQTSRDGKPPREVIPPYFSVKEAVFPFNKFPGVDPILGPEMRSTGEVMGVGTSFGEAMLKSQLGAGSRLPTKGTVVITVKQRRQGAGRGCGARPGGAGLCGGGHPGHGSGHRGGGCAGEGGQQGQGRAAQHRRHGQGRRDPAGVLHRGRNPHRDCRLAPHPHGSAGQPHHLLHHHGRV